MLISVYDMHVLVHSLWRPVEHGAVVVGSGGCSTLISGASQNINATHKKWEDDRQFDLNLTTWHVLPLAAWETVYCRNMRLDA